VQVEAHIVNQVLTKQSSNLNEKISTQKYMNVVVINMVKSSNLNKMNFKQ